MMMTFFAHVLSDDLSLTVHGLSFTHVDLGAVYEKGRLTLDALRQIRKMAAL